MGHSRIVPDDSYDCIGNIVYFSMLLLLLFRLVLLFQGHVEAKECPYGPRLSKYFATGYEPASFAPPLGLYFGLPASHHVRIGCGVEHEKTFSAF